MFGLPDPFEERLDAFLDAGGVMNVREDQAFVDAGRGGLVVFCHATPAVRERLGLRRSHWSGCGSQLEAALTAALYWMR